VSKSQYLRRISGKAIERELDPQGAVLLAYWNGLKGVNDIPLRKDFDPIAVPAALPRIQIVQYDQAEDSLTYRLVGTEEVETRGYDPTGKTIAEGFFGAALEDVIGNYRALLDAREPVCVLDRFAKKNGVFVEDISLFLPLLDEQRVLKFIMVYSYNRPTPQD